jgi:hypothetical protein
MGFSTNFGYFNVINSKLGVIGLFLEPNSWEEVGD